MFRVLVCFFLLGGVRVFGLSGVGLWDAFGFWGFRVLACGGFKCGGLAQVPAAS